jgi:hypothetical protein
MIKVIVLIALALALMAWTHGGGVAVTGFQHFVVIF